MDILRYRLRLLTLLGVTEPDGTGLWEGHHQSSAGNTSHTGLPELR